jgi:lantibiotic modifying enzyme
LELAERTGDQGFQDVGHDALRYEHLQYVPSAGNWPDMRRFDAETPAESRAATYPTTWCHGAAGIAMSRMRVRRLTVGEKIPGELTADLDAALDTVQTDGFGRNHSLCHGDFGNLDVLLQAADSYGDGEWPGLARDTAALVIDGAASTGWLCGLPLGVETPGLMTGLAGVGMGLLRVAARYRVPSVLILEPPK